MRQDKIYWVMTYKGEDYGKVIKGVPSRESIEFMKAEMIKVLEGVKSANNKTS